jgi:hypothetical protein
VTKLTVAFRNFAIAAKNGDKDFSLKIIAVVFSFAIPIMERCCLAVKWAVARLSCPGSGTTMKMLVVNNHWLFGVCV